MPSPSPDHHALPTCSVVPSRLILHGDAADGLAELRDQGGKGRAALIYLDPPYTTGSTFHHYTDRQNTSAWLSGMETVLRRCAEVLHPDGSVWLHLDDAQQHRARVLLDEVFGVNAFVATIIWQRRTTRENRTAFSVQHDYIHVYAPAGRATWRAVRNGLPDTGGYTNPDNDPRGPWRGAPATAPAGPGRRAAQFYTVTTPTGARHDPPRGSCWTYTAPRLAELDAAGRIFWPRGGAGRPRVKKYLSESTGLAPHSIWTADEVGTTASAKRALLDLFDHPQVFDTPKPEPLLERIVTVATDPGGWVIDPFLGSGTTAVTAERTGRRWTGIEQSGATITGTALPRITTVCGPQNPVTVRAVAPGSAGRGSGHSEPPA